MTFSNYVCTNLSSGPLWPTQKNGVSHEKNQKDIFQHMESWNDNKQMIKIPMLLFKQSFKDKFWVSNIDVHQLTRDISKICILQVQPFKPTISQATIVWCQRNFKVRKKGIDETMLVTIHKIVFAISFILRYVESVNYSLV